MSGRTILDADMHMLGQWLVQGWRWWVAELRDLVPARWRRGRADAMPRMIFREDRLVADPGSDRRVAPGRRVVVMVPAALGLSRIVERPAMGERDLQQMVMLEGDMLLPFPPGTTVIAGRGLGAGKADGRIMVEIACLPVAIADGVARAAADIGVVPIDVLVGKAGDPGAAIDFAPAMRAAGLLAKPRSATPFAWMFVAGLVLLNLAMLIWRDAASVDQLEHIVQQQQPAVAVAQTITNRLGRDRALIARSLAARRQHDALGALAEVGRALPAGTWLQRYQWDGPTARLTGYRPPRTDVATALRRSGRFTGVRSMTDEPQAAVPAGEPFDLTAGMLR